MHLASAIAMAALLQRPWSWFGPGNTFAAARRLRDSLALAMGNFTRFPTLARDHNTLMQCSIFLLHRNKILATLRWAPSRMGPSLTPVDVMFPLLLNKAVSTLWPARTRPSVGPGRRLLGRRRKRINLALQGGGAHGAFTWGVLDQILTDERLAIEGISGTSAGALNAVMLADGLARGGPQDARQRLADFWRAASFGGNLPDLQRGAQF